MVWAALTHLAGFMVDLVVGTRRVEHAKDLEIALLRHQLHLLQRRSRRPVLTEMYSRLINRSALLPEHLLDYEDVRPKMTAGQRIYFSASTGRR